MKNILLSVAVAGSAVLLASSANVVENPDYELRLTNAVTPTRVVRTDSATLIGFRAIARPNTWIKIDSTAVLVDRSTGEKYEPVATEGLTMNELFWMPESGEKDFTVIYPPLPNESKAVDYEDGSWRIFGLRLDGEKAVKANTVDLKQWERDNHKPYPGQPDRFFNRDTTTITGLINGYDQRTGIHNLLVYYDDPITGSSIPYYVPVADDGTFSVSFPVESPGYIALSGLKTLWLKYYVEPGRRLDIALDWEDLLEGDLKRNIGDYNHVTHTCFGGELGDINRQLADAPRPVYINIQTMSHHLTPAEAKSKLAENNDNYRAAIDKYMEETDLHQIAKRLLDNRVKCDLAKNILDYTMYRKGNVSQDTLARSLKEPVGLSFYEPVQKLFAENDTWTFAYENYSSLNNQLAFSDLPALLGVENVTYAKFADPGFTFLKESGAELTPTEEAMAQSANELIGKEGYKTQKEFTQFFSYLMAAQTIAQRCGLTDKLKEHYNSLPCNEDSGDRVSDRAYNVLRQARAIQQYAGTDHTPLLWQSAQIAKLCNYGNLKPSQYKQTDVTIILNEIKSTGAISDPDMLTSLFGFYDNAYASMAYELPDDERGHIMRDIIAPFAGKYIMVDFWATTCGPCRGNIESSAEMRERNRDHPEFKMIFVTGNAESPEKAYNAYVAKNLTGETSHRLPQSDFDRLRDLFKFNGIPHYVLIDREGKVVFDDFNHHDLANELAKNRIILK